MWNFKIHSGRSKGGFGGNRYTCPPWMHLRALKLFQKCYNMFCQCKWIRYRWAYLHFICSSFMNYPFCLIFFNQKKLILLILKVIVHFYSFCLFSCWRIFPLKRYGSFWSAGYMAYNCYQFVSRFHCICSRSRIRLVL